MVEEGRNRGSQVTEAELLAAVAARDENALGELYRRYYPRLARFLVRLTDDDALVAEVINDTFLVVWNKAGTFRGDSAVSTWIIGICHKKALKALARLRPHEPLAAADEVRAPPAPDHDIDDAIARLTPNHRMVLILTYQFGYSYREIGEIVNCPENTVKTRMHHARKALKSLLERER